jgi:hypothetical protein
MFEPLLAFNVGGSGSDAATPMQSPTSTSPGRLPGPAQTLYACYVTKHCIFLDAIDRWSEEVAYVIVKRAVVHTVAVYTIPTLGCTRTYQGGKVLWNPRILGNLGMWGTGGRHLAVLSATGSPFTWTLLGRRVVPSSSRRNEGLYHALILTLSVHLRVIVDVRAELQTMGSTNKTKNRYIFFEQKCALHAF